MTEPGGRHAATHGQVVETAAVSGERLLEPLTVTALYDALETLDGALDALYVAGIPRDLIEVVVSREAAERFYAKAPAERAPRGHGRETWRYAGMGALFGFVGGSGFSLVMVLWPGLEAPGGMALVQLAGPNFGAVAGAAAGAVLGSFRRQRPQARHARAAEASNAIVLAVSVRSEREAAVIGDLLAERGGRSVRIDAR